MPPIVPDTRPTFSFPYLLLLEPQPVNPEAPAGLLASNAFHVGGSLEDLTPLAATRRDTDRVLVVTPKGKLFTQYPGTGWVKLNETLEATYHWLTFKPHDGKETSCPTLQQNPFDSLTQAEARLADLATVHNTEGTTLSLYRLSSDGWQLSLALTA